MRLEGRGEDTGSAREPWPERAGPSLIHPEVKTANEDLLRRKTGFFTHRSGIRLLRAKPRQMNVSHFIQWTLRFSLYIIFGYAVCSEFYIWYSVYL